LQGASNFVQIRSQVSAVAERKAELPGGSAKGAREPSLNAVERNDPQLQLVHQAVNHHIAQSYLDEFGDDFGIIDGSDHRIRQRLCDALGPFFLL
jgi:hypothetical protein